MVVRLVACLLSLVAAGSCLNGTLAREPIYGTPPTERYGYCLVHKESINSIVIAMGKNDRMYVDDVFTFNLDTQIWSVQAVVGDRPSSRCYHTCHLVDDRFMYLFGGQIPTGASSELWVFDFNALTWKQIVTLGLESPQARYNTHLFALPLYPSYLFLHGGISALSYTGDTWRYSILDLTWTRVSTTGIDELLYREGVVLPRSSNSTYIVGGDSLAPLEIYEVVFGASGLEAEFSVLPVSSPDRPDPRYVAMFVVHNGRIVLTNGWSDERVYGFADYWEYDLSTHRWTSYDNVVPASLWRDSMTPYQDGNLVYYFGGWGEVIYNTFDVLDVDARVMTRLHGLYRAPVPRANHATALLGNQMYVFGGDSRAGLLSDVWRFNVDNGRWTQVVTVGGTPVARHSCAMVAAGLRLIVFGGMSEVGLLADIWALNSITGRWTELTTDGGSISPMSGHSAVVLPETDFVFLFGGDGETGVRAEGLLYNYVESTTVEVAMVGEPLHAAYRGVTLINGRIIGVGGFADGFEFETIWEVVVDVSGRTATWQLIGSMPKASHGVAVASLGRYLLVGGGVSYDVLDTQLSIYRYSVEDSSLELVLDVSGIGGDAWEPAGGASAVVSKNRLFFFGGNGRAAVNTDIVLSSHYLNNLVVLDLEPLCLGTTEGASDSTSLTAPYDHADGCVVCPPGTYLVTGDSEDVEEAGGRGSDWGGSRGGRGGGGGSARHHSPWSTVNRRSTTSGTGSGDSSTSTTTSLSTTQTSGGNNTRSRCVQCPRGSYSSVHNARECTKCSLGYYGRVVGSSSPDTCAPCNRGTFANVTGLEECYVCPPHTYCPFATISPIPGDESAGLFEESQPDDEDRTGAIRTATALRLLALTCGSALLFSIILFIATVRWFPEKWQFLDVVYNLSHYVASEGVSLKKHRTALGGLFTVLLCIGIPFMVGYVLLPISIQNTIESRTVVPNILVTSYQVFAEYNVVFTLNGYGAACQASSTSTTDPDFGTCAPGLSVSLSADFQASTSQGQVFLCRRLAATVCEVSFHCESCAMTGSRGSLSLVVTTSNSFATSVGWFLNTTAAIPARFSVSKGTLVPADGYVLRGTIAESNISFTAVPIIYYVIFNETRYTGMLMSYLGSTRGSQVDSNSFHAANGLRVSMSFEKTTTTLSVNIDNQLKVTVVLAAILGAISAVVGGGAFILKQTERAITLKKSQSMVPVDLAASHSGGRRLHYGGGVAALGLSTMDVLAVQRDTKRKNAQQAARRPSDRTAGLTTANHRLKGRPSLEYSSEDYSHGSPRNESERPIAIPSVLGRRLVKDAEAAVGVGADGDQPPGTILSQSVDSGGD